MQPGDPNTTSSGVLEIISLSVSYGRRRVLESVSLEVPGGSVVALIGPNGSGKSTLMRAASGVIPVDEGDIRWRLPGQPAIQVLTLSAMKRARLLAVVPQASPLPPAYPVMETVLMGRTPYLNFLGQLSPQDEAIATNALEKVDALGLASRRVGEISCGEQQRVLLARALAQATPILLLDEPTASLDLQYQVSFMELLRLLARQEGLAVLVALHDLNLAAQYADRVVLLVEGRIRAEGTTGEVLTEEAVSAAYHLPVQIVPHPSGRGLLVLPKGN